MRRKRRTHSPEFKAKVVLAAIQGDLTLVERVKKFDVHAKIGQLTMENDFLERGLERIHGPRGKKWQTGRNLYPSLANVSCWIYRVRLSIMCPSLFLMKSWR